MTYQFENEKPYFIYDPEGNGFSYFETEAERGAFGKQCIANYLSDSWNEEVEGVVGGKITHRATETDREDRPEATDADSYDDSGDYWDPDIAYRCNFKLLPLLEDVS